MKKSALTGSLLALALFSASAANAAVTITPATAEELATAFLGSDSGIKIVPGSITFVGTATQSGIYSGVNGLQDGIVMTSGSVVGNDRDVRTNTGPNALLAELAGVSVDRTYDTNLLTFSFTVNDASLTAISTNFVLASEEYPDYVYLNSEYRDVFGFFIDGENYAHFADGSRVIATKGDYVDGADLGYNGKTQPYSLVAVFDPALSVHTLTIGIADVGDRRYDSAVFIQSLSAFSCTGESCSNPGVTPTIPEPETWAMLLAGLGVVGGLARRRARTA